MTDQSKPTARPPPVAGDPVASDTQPLVGYRTNDEWESLLGYVNGLVTEIERLPDEATRERVFDLLQGIDAIHREGLSRLVRLFKEGVLQQVITDPAIRTLMELYDLLPQDPACVTVPDFMDALPADGGGAEILPQGANGHVPIPHWVPAPKEAAALNSGETIRAEIDGQSILICRVDETCFAVSADCLQDGAPMTGARLTGFTLNCPLHAGCLYDVRQGSRIGAIGQLSCFPIREGEDGRLLVGIDMPYSPELPSF